MSLASGILPGGGPLAGTELDKPGTSCIQLERVRTGTEMAGSWPQPGLPPKGIGSEVRAQGSQQVRELPLTSRCERPASPESPYCPQKDIAGSF